MTPILRDVSDGAVIEAIDLHERETSAAYARALGGVVVDRPEMLAYATGLPAVFANGVKDPKLTEATVDPAIGEVGAMLRAEGVRGQWLVGPLATPVDLGERLVAAGLRPGYDLQMMARAVDELSLGAADPAGLVVHIVQDEERHAAWMSVMTGGFDLEDPVTMTIDTTARAVGYGPPAPWVRFVGFADGRPVASSGLMLFGGLAGVYNVTTLPEARRQGFGAALTRAALRHARETGYRVAVLGASDMGRGIYERMGFRDVCLVRQFVHDGPG